MQNIINKFEFIYTKIRKATSNHHPAELPFCFIVTYKCFSLCTSFRFRHTFIPTIDSILNCICFHLQILHFPNNYISSIDIVFQTEVFPLFCLLIYDFLLAVHPIRHSSLIQALFINVLRVSNYLKNYFRTIRNPCFRAIDKAYISKSTIHRCSRNILIIRQFRNSMIADFYCLVSYL